jgi:hypothetical protein
MAFSVLRNGSYVGDDRTSKELFRYGYGVIYGEKETRRWYPCSIGEGDVENIYDESMFENDIIIVNFLINGLDWAGRKKLIRVPLACTITEITEGDQEEYSYDNNSLPFYLELRPCGEAMCLLHGVDDLFPVERADDQFVFGNVFEDVQVYPGTTPTIVFNTETILPAKNTWKRSANAMEAYKEALSDPCIAAMIHCTREGVKTRQRFYKNPNL